MKEEQVTKAILTWLISNNWRIVCFDFPQSGTGKMLHPNGNDEEKNKGAVIPDIVAVKNGVCIFSENKDRFYYPDYQKQNMMKTSNDFSEAIASLLKGYSVNAVYYGIGLPTAKHKRRSISASQLVDFILCVDDDGSTHAEYNPTGIVFD